jgi:hypothetical protein
MRIVAKFGFHGHYTGFPGAWIVIQDGWIDVSVP